MPLKDHEQCSRRKQLIATVSYGYEKWQATNLQKRARKHPNSAEAAAALGARGTEGAGRGRKGGEEAADKGHRLAGLWGRCRARPGRQLSRTPCTKGGGGGGPASPTTATPSGAARYWPGRGRRDGPRCPPPPSPGSLTCRRDGGCQARRCQPRAPASPGRSAAPRRQRGRPLPSARSPPSTSSAAASSCSPLPHWDPPLPYAISAARIEASSPSCQIVSHPHRAVQNTEPHPPPSPALPPLPPPSSSAARARAVWPPNCDSGGTGGRGEGGKERGKERARAARGPRRAPGGPAVTLPPPYADTGLPGAARLSPCPQRCPGHLPASPPSEKRSGDPEKCC
ncbi:uncharacterized protein LOC128850437 [Cuculus canorus]|uniref:uncharacterized protein LOC128850437 n=1 Tax=Cuculus canorus TaxID=55661 RepID=UPI0023AB540C|nr:uncharacterized protein LOC128850437 [Cuculus canorus]